MKITIPFSFLLFVIISCTPKAEREAIQTIEQSIAYHGGKDKWENIQMFSFDKKTILYDEAGEIESQVAQEMEFRLKPYFEAKVTWLKDSVRHRIVFDGITTSYFMGDNEIKNEGFLASKKKEIDAAFYVMTKPFDLLDGKKSKRAEGVQTLPEGESVKAVQVIDGPKGDKNLDIYTYYFDQENYELVGYSVSTSGHTSMVYNRSWTGVENFKFPESRESFRLDEGGNHSYLRASYTYTNFRIQ